MDCRATLVCFAIVCVLPICMSWTVGDETTLRGNLLSGYESAVRPNETVTINIAFQITSLIGVDIKAQTFAASGFWVLEWEDSRLGWTPASYNNIGCLYYYQDTLWTPALVVTNSDNDLSAIDEDTIPLRVWSTGEIEWTPPGIVKVGCEMDTTYFPFDEQTCSVEVTSSGYRLQELSVDTRRGFLFEFYSENGDWLVTGSSSSRSTFTDHGKDYAKMTFSIKIKRRNDYHWINIMIPVIVSGFLVNFVFVLPVDSGEKIGYALTCLLTFVMLLTIISADMPTSAKHVALIEVYITVIMILGALVVIQCVSTINLYNRDDDEEKIPKWMIKATKIGMKICRRKPPSSSKKIHPGQDLSANFKQQHAKPGYLVPSPKGLATPVRKMSVSSDTSSQDEDIDITWKVVSKTLDAVCFRIFLSFISLFTFVYLIIMMA